MFCPNCGKEMSDGASFCPNCGYRRDGSASKSSFNLSSGLGNGFNKKVFILVAVIIVAFVLFKLITSFGDVASFSRELKAVVKQAEDGDYQSIINNNIDCSGMQTYDENEVKAGLQDLLNSEQFTYVKMFKPSKKLINKLKSALDIKYSVKKIEKNHVRLTLNYNLPRSVVISNSKILGKVSQFGMLITQSASNPAALISQLSGLEDNLIEVLNIYKSLSNDNKMKMQFYSDFYKIDGHWKYKMAYYEQDVKRLESHLMPCIREWSNSIGTLSSIFGF